MAQPLKKKELPKRATVSSLKEKLGMTNMNMPSNADKPMEWLEMPKAFTDALKINIPQGYSTLICGHSDSGKSTIINHVIVAAQKQGLIPVIYDTENNFDFTYARDMGMEAEPIYGDVQVEKVDPVTGEVTVTTENRIITYEGNFLYFNNAILAERYGCNDYSTGKLNQKPRKMAVIEDIAFSINELMNMQDDGDIEAGLVFIWDSIGSISCYKSFKSSSNNAMWDAAAISVCFNTILNDRIPRSRKVSSKYTNTFVAINKVWLDNTSNPMPGAPPSLSLKGGNAMFYSARLIILCGGQLKASTKKLTAVTKGLTYRYALQTKLKVLKNQLPNPWTVTYEGEVVCTPHGMISTDKDVIEDYRKTHIAFILKNLNELNASNGVQGVIQEGDAIEFGEEETEE